MGFGFCLEQATRAMFLSSSGGRQERRERQLPFLSMLRKMGHKMWSFLLGMLSLVSLGTSANFQRKIISGREKKGSVFFIILILWSLLYVKLCLLSPGDVAPSYYPHIPSNPLLTYRHLFLKKKFIGQMWWCMPVTQNMGCINRKISVI